MNENQMEKALRKALSVPGFAILGLFLIAIIAVFVGFVALFDKEDYLASGIHFFVGAVALGVIARVSFK